MKHWAGYLQTVTGKLPESNEEIIARGFRLYDSYKECASYSSSESESSPQTNRTRGLMMSFPLQELFIKICGITNLTDAELACSLGANAIGFNFTTIE